MSEEWKEPEESPATFEKLKALLDQAKVKYEVSEHAPVLTSEEAAKVRGATLESGAKAMLLKDAGKKLALEGVPFYMAIISASCKLSTKQFSKLINVNKKSLRMATPKDVWDLTGTVTGAVPPFGKMFNMPLWVDRSLGRNEMINFNCGLRTKSISMRYDDWFKFEQPTFNVFSEEELEKGDLPVAGVEEEKKEEVKKVDPREAKKLERLKQRQEKEKAAALKEAEKKAD